MENPIELGRLQGANPRRGKNNRCKTRGPRHGDKKPTFRSGGRVAKQGNHGERGRYHTRAPAGDTVENGGEKRSEQSSREQAGRGGSKEERVRPRKEGGVERGWGPQPLDSAKQSLQRFAGIPVRAQEPQVSEGRTDGGRVVGDAARPSGNALSQPHHVLHGGQHRLFIFAQARPVQKGQKKFHAEG